MGGLTAEAEVLMKSGRRCSICFGLHGDLTCKRGQIAHLDRNHQNNNIDNLAFLCLEHHDEYDTRTSQSRGWTITEVKRYRAMLYEAIEELHNTKREIGMPVLQYELPILGQISSVTNKIMDAVDKNTGQKYYGVRAYSLLHKFHLTFDVTNPNQFDMRIIRFYLDVLKFIDTAIIGVWENGLGGGMPVREFGCEIEPCVGRYDCFQVSEGFDYVRLSSGEMEAFLVTVGVVKEGIYYLRLGMEYSIGGETRKIEVDDDVLEVGIFDPVFHEPSHDWSQRVVEDSQAV